MDKYAMYYFYAAQRGASDAYNQLGLTKLAVRGAARAAVGAGKSVARGAGRKAVGRGAGRPRQSFGAGRPDQARGAGRPTPSPFRSTPESAAAARERYVARKLRNTAPAPELSFMDALTERLLHAKERAHRFYMEHPYGVLAGTAGASGLLGGLIGASGKSDSDVVYVSPDRKG